MEFKLVDKELQKKVRNLDSICIFIVYFTYLYVYGDHVGSKFMRNEILLPVNPNITVSLNPLPYKDIRYLL